MEIFCIPLLQEQFFKYMILKVSERVHTSFKQPETELQQIVTDIKNKDFYLFDIEGSIH